MTIEELARTIAQERGRKALRDDRGLAWEIDRAGLDDGLVSDLRQQVEAELDAAWAPREPSPSVLDWAALDWAAVRAERDRLREVVAKREAQVADLTRRLDDIRSLLARPLGGAAKATDTAEGLAQSLLADAAGYASDLVLAGKTVGRWSDRLERAMNAAPTDNPVRMVRDVIAAMRVHG